MPSLTDNLIMSGYLLLWVITFIWYHRKSRHIDGGSTVIASYIAYAVFSLFTLNDEIFVVTYEPLRLFPFLYLYMMLIIALSPAIKMHNSEVTQIEDPQSTSLYIPCIILVLCVIAQIPNMLSNFSSGIFALLTDTDAGKDAYLEQASEADNAGSSIGNAPSLIFNILYDCVVFLFFYYLTRRDKSRIFAIVLSVSIFTGMILPVANGQRGSVIKAVLTIVCGYMIFRQFLSARINLWIGRIGIIAGIIVAVPIIAITTSRFSDRTNGTDVGGYVYWYLGQENLYFNNSALDAGGIRYGDRTANLFKRTIISGTPKNYVERRDKYKNLKIDDFWFVTFVGDFTLDYGPIGALLIFIVFNAWALTMIKPRDGTIKLHQLLLVYFTLCICIQGGMTLFSYSDTGNLIIIIFALLYAWLRYHEALLSRFPLLISDENKGTAVNSRKEMIC